MAVHGAYLCIVTFQQPIALIMFFLLYFLTVVLVIYNANRLSKPV